MNTNIFRYYNITDRFCIFSETSIDDSVYRYIHKEYIDFSTNDFCNIPLLGCIRGRKDVLTSSNLKELVKDWLYEDESFLYVKYGNKYLRIFADENRFEIVYQHDFENNVAFYVLELLVRIYAHKYRLDFFHASSFKYNDKVYMLNGFGGSGKTEIMIDFLLKGAAFISDDIVIVNECGKIFPYRVSIPVKWNCISEEFTNQIHTSNYIYRLASYCKTRNGKITKRIYGRLANKYFLGNYSHSQLTEESLCLKFYDIDKCIWQQEANFEGTFNISDDKFFQYMNLCLENESRKYFDFDGFMKLKFPQLKSFYEEIHRLRRQICHQLSPYGLAVKNRDYKLAGKTLLSI